MSAPTILLFGFSRAGEAAYRRLAERLSIEARAVPPGAYALPLSSLLPPNPEAGGSGPLAALPEPMLLMAGFPPGLMDAFLLAARREGLPPAPLKAVLTATNASWDARTLYRALSEEREAFRRGAARAPGAKKEPPDGGSEK